MWCMMMVYKAQDPDLILHPGGVFFFFFAYISLKVSVPTKTMFNLVCPLNPLKICNIAGEAITLLLAFLYEPFEWDSIESLGLLNKPLKGKKVFSVDCTVPVLVGSRPSSSCAWFPTANPPRGRLKRWRTEWIMKQASSHGGNQVIMVSAEPFQC